MSVLCLKKPFGIFITGPTGSGKSSSILSLDMSFPIEVVSVDSRQLYKYAYVGTCAPTKQEKQHFSHHLIHCLDLSETYSAGNFVQDAKKLLSEIVARKNIPIFVGGTFFYMRAFWDGLIRSPNVTKEIYDNVIIEMATMSLEEQFKRLQLLDPIAANRIKPTDKYRVKNFLEYVLLTQSPISTAKKKGGIYKKTCFESFSIEIPRDSLYQKINQRTEEMFEENKIIKEFFEILYYSSSMDNILLQTIGYKQICDQIKFFCKEYNMLYTKNILLENQDRLQKYLEKLKNVLVKEISQKTRRYAKSQETWFRHDSRLQKVSPERLSTLLNEKILLYLKHSYS